MTWERGGPAAVVAALAEHQHAAGHRVSVLTTTQGKRRGERPIELPAAVHFERLPILGSEWLAYAPGFARALRSRLAATDILHVHSIFRYPCLAAIKVAARFDRPVVIRPCGVLHRYGLGGRSATAKSLFLRRYGPLYRSVCDAWHYTSTNELRDSWPFEPVNAFVVPNGIEPGVFDVDRVEARAAVDRRWPAIGGRPYVLFLGRLHPKKRIDLLLDAFLQAAPEHCRLVVAGPDESDLWSAMAARHLDQPERGERVIRLGLVTGQAKVELLAGARLFALSSEHENFGNAVLEALAAGTPVLGSPHVDLVDELADHGLARVAELDLETWKQAIGEMLGSAVVDPASVETARRWVRDHYSWDILSAQLIAEYQRLT